MTAHRPPAWPCPRHESAPARYTPPLVDHPEPTACVNELITQNTRIRSILAGANHPASYTGLDLNRRGIAFCRRTHNLPGLDFVQGDACNLPFPDRSFDAVVNVEASQLYSSFPRFLAEVERVLRPGGHFLYTDFRWVPLIAEWEQDLANAPMRQLSYDNINAEVVRGLDKTMQWRQDLIDRHLPAVLRRRVERFGVPGPRARDALKTGHYKYLMCSFVKA
jgi:fatty-acid O-methyltransferase